MKTSIIIVICLMLSLSGYSQDRRSNPCTKAAFEIIDALDGTVMKISCDTVKPRGYTYATLPVHFNYDIVKEKIREYVSTQTNMITYNAWEIEYTQIGNMSYIQKGFEVGEKKELLYVSYQPDIQELFFIFPYPLEK
jgi:hypothetical protein